MGCNLCTLQKREEHYKLLYEIAQVNGKDLSKGSHEEALEAFRSTKDPIVVQVLRRSPVSRGNGHHHDVYLVDVCTQTDITFEHIMALSKLRPATPPVPDTCPFHLSDSCHSLHTMEHEYYEGSEFLPSLPADSEKADTFEYEEVELYRQSSQEKLGLTLCYRTDDEEDVALYVSEVGPNSIAARDGRIREGDRIIQINGQDVQDREEAVALLANEDSRSILLLVARPEMQLEEGWLDEEHGDFLEELKMEVLEGARCTAVPQKQVRDNNVTTDMDTFSKGNQNKDGGVSQKDSSMRHEVHSDNEPQNLVQNRLSRFLRGPSVGSLVQETSVDSNTQSNESLGSEEHLGLPTPQKEEEEEEEDEECDHFQQLLELKCQIRNSSEYGLYYSRRSTIGCSLTEQTGVEHELRLLNEELKSIELECQNIMQAHQLRKARDQNGPPGTPRSKLADISEHPEKSDKDSSSAYNTAESSRSTPLAMDRSPEHSLQRTVSLTNQKNLRSTLATSQGLQATILAKASCLKQGKPPRTEGVLSTGGKHCGHEKPQIPQAPYLSSDHNSQYGHTNAPAHARHYQSYMHLVQQQSAMEFSQCQLSLLGVDPKMEWKVKVRADGTRYITKRPARDKILRERALKIREERAGMTTDDDAVSELKMGRYWSKEERKQQLARAREQRRRREFMQRCRLEGPRETSQSAGEGRKEVSIIELSNKKMMKKRNKKILDNWMTIQELMTHGAKATEVSGRVHNAFLSVTTV
ncbi:PDZ domain-containing RING finger protein 4-like isoform X2 [Scleropages formosus]|uniref:PDZ domain-containing RING finger protein 4-like isoform X2 n=1 Tax=Scleropages formosus TaxID=113540 RepID=UPI0010FAB11C|nr:PDZ domain-containing RING finger protein 4-like isoform X2 [Scleropages formosus]